MNVTDGVGILDVLVLLTSTVDVGSVIVVFLILVASCKTVDVVPGGVNVDLSVTVEIWLMTTVDVGSTIVALRVVREVVVARIVSAGRVTIVVLRSVLVVWACIVTPLSVEVEVLILEKIVELKVCVWPFRDMVEMDVPCRSTRIVEVD